MGDIDFEVIFATKNSNKFQKTRFWKNKSVESVVTLEGLPFNSSMISFHVEFPYFVVGSHLGQWHMPH
jgi:hypothetical protein